MVNNATEAFDRSLPKMPANYRAIAHYLRKKWLTATAAGRDLHIKHATIAEACHCSIRTVVRAMAMLANAGIIDRTKRACSKGKGTIHRLCDAIKLYAAQAARTPKALWPFHTTIFYHRGRRIIHANVADHKALHTDNTPIKDRSSPSKTTKYQSSLDPELLKLIPDRPK